ncbi:related to Monocarboxylate transporter [Sporisorium scitamineum]|uniref:Related to Monocarboxylate transporter n=1 Tax=Sporisorium scitamineum TaxID=49012 RepID=A0A127ZHN4_9BASI|nr:related to Monocarboxylate transporter [Sporisorium scitamineum]
MPFLNPTPYNSDIDSSFPALRRAWTEQDLLYSPYGYQPALSAPLLFCILFTISGNVTLPPKPCTTVNGGWGVGGLTFGCLCEKTVGYVCSGIRTFSTPFEAEVYSAMQTVLVLTPAFFRGGGFRRPR